MACNWLLRSSATSSTISRAVSDLGKVWQKPTGADSNFSFRPRKAVTRCGDACSPYGVTRIFTADVLSQLQASVLQSSEDHPKYNILDNMARTRFKDNAIRSQQHLRTFEKKRVTFLSKRPARDYLSYADTENYSGRGGSSYLDEKSMSIGDLSKISQFLNTTIGYIAADSKSAVPCRKWEPQHITLSQAGTSAVCTAIEKDPSLANTRKIKDSWIFSSLFMGTTSMSGLQAHVMWRCADFCPFFLQSWQRRRRAELTMTAF